MTRAAHHLSPPCPASHARAANADVLGNYAQYLLGERGDHAAAEEMFKRALAARGNHVINLVGDPKAAERSTGAGSVLHFETV